jgi:hypothetical protein
VTICERLYYVYFSLSSLNQPANLCITGLVILSSTKTFAIIELVRTKYVLEVPSVACSCCRAPH